MFRVKIQSPQKDDFSIFELETEDLKLDSPIITRLPIFSANLPFHTPFSDSHEISRPCEIRWRNSNASKDHPNQNIFITI
jgi:hypothetical protein